MSQTHFWKNHPYLVKGLDEFKKARNLIQNYKRDKDVDTVLAMLHNNEGTCFERLGNSHEALISYSKSLSTKKELRALQIGYFDKALISYGKSFTMKKELGALQNEIAYTQSVT